MKKVTEPFRSWLARSAGALALLTLIMAAMPSGLSLAQGDDGLVGEYTVGISREDVPTDQPDGFSYVGRWRIAFNDDGTYFAERLDTGRVVDGTYVATGTHLTITDVSGLLSCSQAASTAISPGDVSVGEYDWSRTGGQLTLVVAADQCPGRVLLFTTHPMETFVPCATTPEMVEEMRAELPASPVAVASETSDSALDALTPVATVDPTTRGDTVDAATLVEIETSIDDLLLQMTACWATGEPSQWLPLLSQSFRQALVTANPDFEVTLSAAMASPIVWERAGDIDVVTPEDVSAIVKTTTGPEEDFGRLVFVVEDGEWRWNGS